MSHDNTKTKGASEPGWVVNPGARVWVGGHDRSVKANLESRLPRTRRPPTGPLDLALIAPCTIDEAIYFADKVTTRLVTGAALWVILPQCSSDGGPPQNAILLAHIEKMAAAGWRVAERTDTDRELTSMRLERIAHPAPAIDPTRSDGRAKQPAGPAPRSAG